MPKHLSQAPASSQAPAGSPAPAATPAAGQASQNPLLAAAQKLFGGLKMNWPAVIIFALAAGLYTGIMGSIPALAPTSFHDICVSYECWVILAFIIAANCGKGWEAALKIFVFFLISQPLVYAIEVLTGNLQLDMAIYYYRTIWGPATLFTLPGGFVAHLIKRQDPLGAIVLGLGNAILAVMAINYAAQVLRTPPFHLLTVIVCVATIFVMTFAIQKTRKDRLICFATVAAALGAVVAYALVNHLMLF
ncbi:hypothetical protein [Paratractidigestivibacter sp.]|uniref:hypothetical protein n=1 Tax=Paratractidigestivibacter sp. TaxID=2847316 RepID=UPI002ABE9DED|nr:hypothetical protein [Paratractidigestivibacter sp.]